MSKNTKIQCAGLTKTGKRCSRNGKYEITHNDNNKYNLCGTHNKSYEKSKDNGDISNFKIFIELEEYSRQNQITEEGLECSIHDDNIEQNNNPIDKNSIKKIIMDNNSFYSDSEDEIEQDPNNKSEYIRKDFYDDGDENDDIINCVQFRAVNGQILFLEKSTYKLYIKDTDDDDEMNGKTKNFTLYGIEIGELTRVSDKKAPIVYKGHYWIASREKEIKYNKKMYKICDLTEKCYQLGDYGIYDYFGNGYRNNRGRYSIKPYISE